MRFHQLAEDLRGTALGDVQGAFDTLNQAQKFYAGESDQFSGVVVDGKGFPRLPFPFVAVELSALAMDGSHLPVIVLAGEDLENKVIFDVFEKHADWAYRGSACLARQSGEIRYRNRVVELDTDGRSLLRDNVRASVVMLGKFLAVLNCRNCPVEVVEPPVALNKKRQAKGRLPIYSYKILVIRREQKRRLSSDAPEKNSRRIHLRRGHIKHRKTGDFWWEPCVVGNGGSGVVMKDYDASRLAE